MGESRCPFFTLVHALVVLNCDVKQNVDTCASGRSGISLFNVAAFQYNTSRVMSCLGWGGGLNIFVLGLLLGIGKHYSQYAYNGRESTVSFRKLKIRQSI